MYRYRSEFIYSLCGVYVSVPKLFSLLIIKHTITTSLMPPFFILKETAHTTHSHLSSHLVVFLHTHSPTQQKVHVLKRIGRIPPHTVCGGGKNICCQSGCMHRSCCCGGCVVGWFLGVVAQSNPISSLQHCLAWTLHLASKLRLRLL
jgi:hypothetical protein